MKKIPVKNQVIIAALTLMIAGVGYLNFAGREVSESESTFASDRVADEGESTFASDGVVDEDDLTYAKNSEESNEDFSGTDDTAIELNSDEDKIGEAVLTSTDTVSNLILSAKLKREQQRSVQKEDYMKIINDTSISDDAKSSAIDAYVKLSDIEAKEADCEIALTKNGFSDSMVTISDETVEVTINRDIIDENEKVKIETAIVNSVGCDLSEVVISLVE